ncbi:MAG: SnoaL-like polyketide cyclase [Thermoleophilaceae bacterium]|jgi:ketosteroid isomerase-like protein|nr:SnoaL-like polyketide cyclase [Thermoleophilaceae bacterium]
MSGEKLEQVYYELVEAWNRGDLDALVGLMAEDVSISTALAGVEGGYSGHAGARRWWNDFHDVFPDWHAEPVTVRAIGEATVAQLRLTGHGGESGAPVDLTMWHVVNWRADAAVRISRHDTESEALEAAGVSE